MSSALVRKSLELFDDDLITTDGNSNKKKKKNSEDDPMSLISTNRKGVKKELRKLKQRKTKRQTGPKQTWSAIELYDYHQAVDYTEASVQALQRISKTNQKDQATAHAILGHHQSKNSEKRNTQQKETKEESTVFTDEDFKNFEKEYFS